MRTRRSRVAAKKLRTLRSQILPSLAGACTRSSRARGYEGSAIHRVMDSLPADAEDESLH